MRFPILLLVVVSAACRGPAGTESVESTSGYEVDAAGAPAMVDERWTLQGLGQGIGVVLGAVRCADRLFLGDQHGGIRRLNLATRETEPTLARDVLAMSLAADCRAGVIYAFGPGGQAAGRSRSNQLRGFDMKTGREVAALPLKTLTMPATAGSVIDGRFVVGGLWMPMADGEYRHPPAPEFYRDKKIGLVVDLASGEWSAPVPPFDLECRGGGRCAGGSLWPIAGNAWLASQPATPRVALYDADFRLTRTIDVSSPLFRHDGRSVEVTDAAASMQWSATNSLIRMSMPIGGMIATVHSLVRLPADYVFGQSVEFDWWMNLHALDGRKLVSDISLPGWPIGWDDEHLYAVEYGPNGRHGAPDSLTVLRVPVREGREGFSR